MALDIAPGKTRIGWIGTGVMGSSMCGHLIDAGYQATVYNRTPEKTKTLAAKGAAVADSPREVAQASDVIFTIVGYPRDVRDVILGEHGVSRRAKQGSVIVDMTTSEPALAVEIFQPARAKCVHAIDAPVSGGDVGAREARLSIMIGGEQDIAEALRPLFETMGKTIVYQGKAGSGQHTKMVNQILISTTMIGVCEALLYAYKAGLDLNTVMQSVSSGAAGSWSLTNLGAAHDRRQLRARLLRRALPQGHGHRPGRVSPDEPCPARPGPRRAALPRRRKPRAMAARGPMRSCWRWPTCPAWIGRLEPADNEASRSSRSPRHDASRSCLRARHFHSAHLESRLEWMYVLGTVGQTPRSPSIRLLLIAIGVTISILAAPSCLPGCGRRSPSGSSDARRGRFCLLRSRPMGRCSLW